MKTSQQQNIRIQQWVVVLAVVLFAIKLTAYFLTLSLAVLTDALESIVNIIAGLMGLYSLHISAKPRDDDHPYGHGKVEFITSAIEGTLILIAGVIIIVESTDNFFSPTSIHKLDYGIILISITGLINFIVGTICIREGKKTNSIVMISSGKHLQSDTYSTLGIVVGLVLILATNILWLDGVVAITFALLILYTGYKIIRKSLAGIMDEADVELLRPLVNLLNRNRRANWIDLHNVRIIKFGPVLHLDAHLTVPWYLTVREAHEEIETLHILVSREFGESLELFVHSDACEEFSCPICDKQECTVRKFPFKRKITWTVENISANEKHQLHS
ncbi:MAG: cation diffusion facilitator family transporter [Bacteroidota bacterium]